MFAIVVHSAPLNRIGRQWKETAQMFWESDRTKSDFERKKPQGVSQVLAIAS
jgi:hypothetical protein